MTLTDMLLMFRPLNVLSLTHIHAHSLTLSTVAIANEAEKYKELLVPDEGAEYDQLIEINLDKVNRYMYTVPL